MSESKVEGSVVLGGIKCGLVCYVFGSIAVLLLALVAQAFTMSDELLSTLALVMRAVAVLIGVAVSVKHNNLLAKALLGVVVYSLLNVATSLLAGGGFAWSTTLLEFVVSLAAAIVAVLLKGKR